MKFFHRTFAAETILSEGFRDSTGNYMTVEEHTGVFISDFPLDINEGAKGNQLLMLEIPEGEVLPYEWEEEDKPYREFCVPAELLNRFGKPTLIDEDSEEGEELIYKYEKMRFCPDDQL